MILLNIDFEKILNAKSFDEILKQTDIVIGFSIYATLLLLSIILGFWYGLKSNFNNRVARIFFWSIYGVIFAYIPTFFYAIGYFVSMRNLNSKKTSDLKNRNFNNNQN